MTPSWIPPAASLQASGHRIRLDVHAHLVPLSEGLMRDHEGVRWQDGRLLVDGHALGPAALFLPEQLVAWMDEQGVEHAWVSIPPPVYRQHLAQDAAARWLHELDEALSRSCDYHPGRLSPLHHLPLEHPALAVRMAAQAIQAGQTRFSAAAGGHEAILYSSPALEPLWRMLNEVAGFVFLHPGKCCDARLDAYYLNNLLGNPHETAVAASHLVMSGVCDRHPGIRFCLAHGGGTTPMIAGRLQRGHVSRRPGVPVDGVSPPQQALRGFMADCIVHDAGGLALAAQVFGADHLVFGSDWPFPMGLLQPHVQLEGLDAGLLRRILQDNAADLIAQGPQERAGSA